MPAGSPRRRLHFPSTDAMPSPRAIAALAQSEASLVLSFPTQFEILAIGGLQPVRDLMTDFTQRFVDELQPLLPDHTVFDAGSQYDEAYRLHSQRQSIGALIPGTARITMLRVLSEQTVLIHADAFTQAACRFREIASELAGRLSQQLNLSVEDFGNMEFERSEVDWRGMLDAEWRWGFHGRQCRFDNLKTDALVEVELCFGEEFGVLDPWFFAQFLHSMPEYEPLTALLDDDYHESKRVLEILHRHGRLQRVMGPTGRTGLAGIATPMEPRV